MDKNWTILIIAAFAISVRCVSALTTYGVQRTTTIRPPTTTKPILTKVYHVHTGFTANWYRAYHHCAQNNMQLATIDSEFEFDQLKKQIKDTKFTDDFWIGFTKLGNPKFYWFGYKKPAVFDALETIAGCSECSCAAVNIENQWSWSTKQCDVLSYFICESKN